MDRGRGLAEEVRAEHRARIEWRVLEAPRHRDRPAGVGASRAADPPQGRGQARRGRRVDVLDPPPIGDWWSGVGSAADAPVHGDAGILSTIAARLVARALRPRGD